MTIPQNNSSKLASGTNPIFRDLEQVIRRKPNFDIILIKLREILFSIVLTKIDDKNLRKNRDQGIFRANMNLLYLRFWSLEMILNSSATVGRDQILK